jgi:hypothetical protein
MPESFCASILQLNPNILSVTRSTDRLLENAQRCLPENDNAYISEEPNEARFKVRDLTDGYQYELTGNSPYYELKFFINEDILSVVIDKTQVDVVNLAENIAKLARIQQNAKVLARREEQYPVNRVMETVMHQAVKPHS